MNKQDLKDMLEFAGVDITKGKAKALLESSKITAQWKKTKGPNDTPGYALFVPNTKGDKQGLHNMGFTQDKPKTSGTVTLYHGASGKDVSVNLDNYSFSVNEGNQIETETGTAMLQSDGSMLVDNSGYKRKVTPEQVKAAWAGSKTLPNTPKDVADMKKDGVSASEVEKNKPVKDGQYYDFGEEMHIIPTADEFK